jgi:hypothetical protein
MIAGLFNELCGHPDAVAGFAETAFEHVADAEFTPDLFHIDRTALEGKRRIPGDHEAARSPFVPQQQTLAE